MPALKRTNFSAEVTWLGLVMDRVLDLCAVPQSQLQLRFAGPEGESHGGLTRPSCSRVTAQYQRGTDIRNVRQISLVAAEDIAAIAGRIGLEELDPALLGANIVVSGLPDFSHVPPSSRLQGPDGTAFVVDMENRPCNLPARVIETANSGHGKAFLKAAKGLRGVTAWVECEGVLRLKDRLSLHIPDQPVWRHLEAARGESNKFPIRH
jgi:hypothetical protein